MSAGAQERRTGRPFVGQAGKFLDHSLAEVGLSRKDVFVTSVEKYAPPDNRAPTHQEIAACKPVLVRQIQQVDPDIVVLLGRVAERTLKGEPVLRRRRVLITVHPAAARRFPWLGCRFRRDLRRLRRWLEG